MHITDENAKKLCVLSQSRVTRMRTGQCLLTHGYLLQGTPERTSEALATKKSSYSGMPCTDS